MTPGSHDSPSRGHKAFLKRELRRLEAMRREARKRRQRADAERMQAAAPAPKDRTYK